MDDMEEEEEEYAIVPPDGGWGWVVVASAFYCNVVADGIQLSFGVFLQEIADYFKVEKSKVSLIGSLMFGTHLLMGPVCAGFSNTFGIRPVACVGSIICTVGLAACYFTPVYEYLYFAYGLLGGIGLGLIYMNSLVITSLYFSRLRALAVAVVVCGTGFGTVVFALAGNYMLKMTSWQISFLIQSLFAASTFFAALTFRPLKPQRIVVTTNLPPVVMETARSRIESMTSFGTRRATIYVKRSAYNRPHSLISAMTIQGMALEHVAHQTVMNQAAARYHLSKWFQNNRCWSCYRKFKKFCKCFRRRQTNVLLVNPETKNEIFNDDSYFRSLNASVVSGGVSRYVTSVSMESSSYVFSRLHLGTSSEIKKNTTACSPLKQTMITMLDCRLLKSLSFFLFSLSGALAMSALLIVFTYERDRAISHGFSEDMATCFVMALGGANMFWRLVLGGISIFPQVNHHYLVVIGMVLGGLAAAISGLNNSLAYQFITCIAFGFGMACFAVLRPVILVELVGTEHVINATGISLLWMGISCVLGPPITGTTGIAMEETKNYEVVFYIAGGIFAVAGLMLIGLTKLREKEIERENRRNIDNE